ncbi:MAG: efflux transporter outer membrane subunit [Muribaculaceae bacterium]|nr:efflux transporter outer membrane subunit [Muribaculaceae bacterium]
MHRTLSLLLLFITIPAVKSSAVNVSNMDSIPGRWLYSGENFQPDPAEDQWWTLFGDTLLNNLIAESEENNSSLIVAMRNIEIARQNLNIARSQYFPQIGMSASWTKTRDTGYGTSRRSTGPDYSSQFAGTVDMSWQIDLFGKISAKAKQQKELLNATRAERTGMMVSVAAEIATNYLQLRATQAKLSLAQEHIASQEHVLNIAKARHEAGLASKLDVAQAQTIYNSTLATIPMLEADSRAYIDAIALLTGAFPDQMVERLSRQRLMPSYNHVISTGIPMELVRRRPDILQAEYQLAASAAAVGIAKKDFLPVLTLEGSIGTAAHNAGDLFKNDSFTYSITPTLSWTIFSGMSRTYSLRSAKAQMEADIENYNYAIRAAIEEVDNAMSRYQGELHQIERLTLVVGSSRETFDLSLDLYKQGLTGFLNVANAQIDYLNYSTSLISAREEALLTMVSLYKALGGGWE